MSAVDVAVPRETLVGRGFIVDSLEGALRDGQHGLKVVPGLLKRVCNEECWRARYIESTKSYAEFDSFIAFVESSPPEGLGVDLDTLRKVCRDDVEALDIIDRETKRPAHIHVTDLDNIQVTPAPTGTSVEAALRRLRKDAPELHARVIAGELSPNAAAIEAGFRRKTITVPADTSRVAVTLSRHFTHDELRAIVSDLATMLDWRP